MTDEKINEIFEKIMENLGWYWDRNDELFYHYDLQGKKDGSMTAVAAANIEIALFEERKKGEKVFDQLWSEFKFGERVVVEKYEEMFHDWRTVAKCGKFEVRVSNDSPTDSLKALLNKMKAKQDEKNS